MKKRILVVDDDPQIREALGKLLRAEGYEVVLAADGREGVEQFDPQHMDLLLLDLQLPVRSGWDIFGTVTSLNPWLPIIVITGRPNQYELATQAGVCALMEKPLDVPTLLRTIASLLAEPPELRLKRLVGLHDDMRYVPPPPV
jgi:CheY-like chemotaxis protein